MEQRNTTWLIDDNELDNFLNERVITLNKFSDNVVVFNSARKAFEALEEIIRIGENFPNYIFLDLNMPEMDGWEFLECYHQLPDELKHNCKLFMLSSSFNIGDIDRSKEQEDVRNFISKPLSAEDLFAIKDWGQDFASAL